MKACISLGLLALSLAAAATATASNNLNPRGIPACTSAGNDDVCRLPVRNGHFSTGTLEGWESVSVPGVGRDIDGNAYAVTPPGSAIRQTVAVNTLNLTADSTFILHFRVLAESGDGSIDARLALRDDTGKHRVELGRTTVHARRGQWSVGELVVAGQPFANPAHVEVTLANDSLGGTRVQVDDVYLLENVNAGAF
ncbi:hypothetical protein FIV34_05715 [Luteibacter pinisoli]|uniref:CBM-cenC domain-containing protein n=1 Tax=Luteibacter pinisoli TaxID=2589080 RepID=A0A4Y5Z0C9_9GAMM|nr:hypothetical protein [Luteibacter pinisoli]QDE38732.1 hypothetical protein FIV34_05715 [Luteibacter pinisoli]